ncbi:MAG: L,D-transpeptidase family protein [Clostridia bacterium]
MMKRILTCALLTIMLLAMCVPGYAAPSKLETYGLVVNGKAVTLSDATGYLFKNGRVLMMPIEAVCKALGLSCDVSKDRKSALISCADGTRAQIRLDTRAALVDGKKQPLKAKTLHQDGKLLTADVRLLKYLGMPFKHYTAPVARKAGYPSGVLVISSNGGSLALPELAPSGDVLPDALKPAAKNATQIVGVAYKGGSSAVLALYEKKDGKWLKQYTTSAFVGKEGIDKTREGDGKTPTGTFNLTTPFGIKADPGARMKGYLKVSKYHYWSGQNGPNYNRLVDTRKAPDYKPSRADEQLIKYAPNYNYCLFVDYNKEGVAGKGSAIFLHCKGRSKSTGGCIAVDERVMKSLVQTLGAGAKIVIY